MKNPTVKPVEQQIKPESETQTAGTAEIETEKPVSIVHQGFKTDDERQKMVQYAYEIGGMDLVTLIECENGTRDPFRKAYGEEDSRGYCMINRRWHKDIVDNDKFRNDWEWQLDRCNDLMKGGTKFYGRQRIIKGQRCSDYVKNRFILE